MTTATRKAPARRRLLATLIAAATLMPACLTHGQVRQGTGVDAPVPGSAPQARAPTDPRRLSCNDLKAQLKTEGELSLLSGPGGGWGDTFYGPAVPRCPFWQMPQFAYVAARDGLCGVGYVCVDKYSID